MLVRGTDVVLSVRADGGAFLPVGGLRSKVLSLNAGPVDVTHVDSGGFRERLSGSGLREVQVTGRGVFVDDAASEVVRSLFFSGDQAVWRVALPRTGTIEGFFAMRSLTLSGDARSEAGFSISLVSSGTLLFESENA